MSLPAPYFQDESCTIYHGDCRELLPEIASADLVLTDPPYGTTANQWDVPIPPSELAGLLRRFRTVVMTGSQPFSSEMVCADRERFRHEWIWIKDRGSNFANTVREPMKEHESVLVFSDPRWTYNKQMQQRVGGGLERVGYSFQNKAATENYRQFDREGRRNGDTERVPASWQFFARDTGLHPTQKPLALMEYLVLTYSNSADLILDPYMGSGTTLRAAKDLGRKAIGIEIEERYCEIAAKRLAQAVLPGLEAV